MSSRRARSRQQGRQDCADQLDRASVRNQYSYPPFLLKGLWIKFGVAPQAADSKHLFPCAALRGNTGSISTLPQNGTSTFTMQGL
jgi:hypothetical protein